MTQRALLAILVPLLACHSVDEASAEPRRARPKSRPVVLVELFTSQGCSSCPPADRLLSRIGRRAEGADVIALAYHVDYWNDLGWRDPFSAAEWTERQRRYARTIAGGRVYTPQLVVQGRAHVVGSVERDVVDAIQSAAGAGARIDARATLAGGRLRVRAEVSEAAATDERPMDLLVAVTESGLTTGVPRGENAGRDLTDDFVVRRLERAARIGASGGTGAVELRIDPSWRADRLGVVVFLQDSVDLRIESAVRAPL